MTKGGVVRKNIIDLRLNDNFHTWSFSSWHILSCHETPGVPDSSNVLFIYQDTNIASRHVFSTSIPTC